MQEYIYWTSLCLWICRRFCKHYEADSTKHGISSCWLEWMKIKPKQKYKSIPHLFSFYFGGTLSPCWHLSKQDFNCFPSVCQRLDTTFVPGATFMPGGFSCQIFQHNVIISINHHCSWLSALISSFCNPLISVCYFSSCLLVNKSTAAASFCHYSPSYLT